MFELPFIIFLMWSMYVHLFIIWSDYVFSEGLELNAQFISIHFKMSKCLSKLWQNFWVFLGKLRLMPFPKFCPQPLRLFKSNLDIILNDFQGSEHKKALRLQLHIKCIILDGDLLRPVITVQTTNQRAELRIALISTGLFNLHVHNKASTDDGSHLE